MSAALSAPTRKAAAAATLELPFRIPAKEWFKLSDCATHSGMSESYVEKKFDEGTQLSGHEHNGGTGERTTKRVPRVWFIAWMISTARYTDEALADAFCACLARFPAETLRRIMNDCRLRLDSLAHGQLSGASATKSQNAVGGSSPASGSRG